MYRTLFDPDEIPADIREFFEETSAQCGSPWVRVVETHYTPGGPKHSGNAKALRYIRDGEREDSGYKTRHDTTTGWQPGCQCASVLPCHDERQELKGRDSPIGVDSRVGAAGGAAAPAQPIPCTVLDPFAGAGTTLLVADRLQRNAVGIELNAAYTEMAMERCRRDAPLFADLHPPPAEDPEDERIRDLFAAAAD